ncbi:MAG: uncharacterized protein JWM19_2531 [Actinomycetia bacterium]|nr:uncharacterized protein [Actinomycetes bacterium]
MPEEATVRRQSFTIGENTTSYLDGGRPDAPLLVFVHGWPALGSTWRHQLAYFATHGFRVVAPDMRGYGLSTVYGDRSQYRQELIVADMIALIDHLGRQGAVWIGHDWGTPTVWNIAAHFPARCAAVATLAVPFGRLERGLEALLAAVDRRRYPVDSYPYGQFDYMVFYEQHPDRATSVFDANPAASVKALFRGGSPTVHTHPARTALITRDGGWFGGASEAPDYPLDTAVLAERDQAELTEALARNGFGGPTSYYLNHEANAAYAGAAENGGRLEMPVLFIGAAYDPVADLTGPAMLQPMRQSCTDLVETTVPAGHWLQLEAAAQVNEILHTWLTDHTTRSSIR